MHEWMTDNGQTPHLVVDVGATGVLVPPGYAKDGRVILNISWQATQHLKLGNDAIEFSARFGGASHDVIVPADAMLGIYARETGQGMLFQDEEGATPPPAGSPAPGSGGGTGTRPRLRVVK